MKKIKILHTIRQGLIGGGETHVLDLVQHLNNEKFESYVLSFTDGPMIDRLNELGIRNQVIHTTKPFDFRVRKPIIELLKKEQFDIIHAHGSRAASNLLGPSKKCKIPIIYTVHGWSFHDDQPPLVKKIRVTLEKYISNRTDLNISVSKSNQDTGKKNFGKYNSIVINNGININKFNPNLAYKDIREELKIDKKKTLVCGVMRMTIQKDPINLIKAFSIALEKATDIHLLIVGSGELKDQAVEKASQLGISEHVTFEKFRTDVPDVLSCCDIYSLVSLWEGLPIGLLEAMSMENAVIASNVDGSREIVQNESNGLLIEPRSPEMLAEAILKIHRDSNLKKKLATSAASTVKEKYNVIKMTEEIEHAYLNLLNT